MPASDGNGFSQRYSTIVQTVTVVALFVAGFWAGVISPLAVKITEIEKGGISLREHEEFKLRIDNDIARLDHRIALNSLAVVPRAEHEARWSAYEANQKLLSERLNEVRNLAGANSTVPLRDEMTRVQNEINDLRKLLLDRK